MSQKAATAVPDVDGARHYIEHQVREYRSKPWWGPVTDVVGRAAGLRNEVITGPEGQVKPYFALDPGGAVVLLRAAFKNHDAFVLAKHVVASCINAQQPIPSELRDFTTLVLTGEFPEPKRDGKAKKRSTWERDIFLHHLAWTVQRDFGLFRSENEAGSANSGLSAVSLIYDACLLNPELEHLEEHTIKKAVVRDRPRRDLQDAAASVGSWLVEHLERTYGDAWEDLP